MAFLNKIGNILKNPASKHINSGSSFVSTPSFFQAIRCSTTGVYIGGLSHTIDESSLKEVFGKYGDVLDARLIARGKTGRFKGFGFVTYRTKEEATSAIQALDGQDVHGCVVRVNYAVERPIGGGVGRAGAGYGPLGESLGRVALVNYVVEGQIGVGGGYGTTDYAVERLIGGYGRGAGSLHNNGEYGTGYGSSGG